MVSICFFASHYAGDAVPEYIKVYLAELGTKFNRTVLLCENEPDAGSAVFLQGKNVEWSVVRNQGYDFGKWSEALKKHDVSAYDTVGLVNDSCVLFRPLDAFWSWLRNENAEVFGMTRSEFRGDHIQSYFLVLRGRAIPIMLRHFSETATAGSYDEAITKYELGLSARFLREGLRMESFVHNHGYKGEFSPYYRCVATHIAQGLPLIKRRILMADYRKAELFTLARMNFRISPAYYAGLIKSQPGKLIFDPFILVKQNKLSLSQRIRYELTRTLINVARPIRRLAFSGK